MELSEIIAAELSSWGMSDVERTVFGTDDPSEIDGILSQHCVARLGERPADGLFYRSSVGCVAGMRLASGRQVVLKAYQNRWSRPFLNATLAVQAHLEKLGFPCARPLGAPSPLQSGRPNLATAETWLHDPGMSAHRSAGARRASAAGLARQAAFCRDLRGLRGLDQHPLRRPAIGLYAQPHSPLFDFALDAQSARWIDSFAARAVALRDSGREAAVIAHTDWSARNVRLHDGDVVAVYDWDSVAKVRESTAVGQAAVTWCVTSEPGGSVFPSAPVVAAFISDYEQAAGSVFSEAQIRAAGAAAVWNLAYTARCEHALEASGRARPDQRGARDRLVADGEILLHMTRE